MLQSHTRGSTNVTPPVFLLANYNYNYTEIYIYRGYVLYKVQIIFPQSAALSTHFSTFAWATLRRSRKILCCSVGALHVSTLYFRPSSTSAIRQRQEMYELLDGPDTVKCMKFKRSQYAHRIVRMGNTRIWEKVLNRKFRGRRPVKRPLLRWEDVRRDFFFLLMNIRGCRRLAEDRNIWRRRSVPSHL